METLFALLEVIAQALARRVVPNVVQSTVLFEALALLRELVVDEAFRANEWQLPADAS
jgi:hypothetical protein